MVRETHTVNTISFIDIEVQPNQGKILDIGAIDNNGSVFHKNSIPEFIQELSNVQFVCGHNIFNHDLKYIGEAVQKAGINLDNCIDTLNLSPLLFPTKPYHRLVKDDKLQPSSNNNPVNDAMNARDLFFDEVQSFINTDEVLQQIYYGLLNDKKEFQGFFKYLNFHSIKVNVEYLIRQRFNGIICDHANLTISIEDNPIALAYSLSLIDSFIKNQKAFSITPPWVIKRYPEVERIMYLLRSKPCLTGCTYCSEALNATKGLKRFFGYDAYRTFGGEPLQEHAVKAALNNKSILAIFPTGGGKSITFQVPALVNGEASRALTIVISPLQSLMKDQVDNLEKAGITNAVTVNGLLDPIERAKSFQRVEDGSASILYISPESLRSQSIVRLMLNRKIARFVIDEAHCFSSWGQDFRVDYLYIGDFIKNLQTLKNLDYNIPVSCFTATAKQKVIEDIKTYFYDKLGLELEIFSSKVSRTNLHYKVVNKIDEEDKYQAARNLIEAKKCPTIIYVSRTSKSFLLAERLSSDGFKAKPYHGKMDIKEKTSNQNAFIKGEVDIMVATSAFGMGVDKKDVGMVIHYEISDSLENYVQEAGRAGRDQSIEADCFVLFNEEDLSKHFILLNQTKLSMKEIQQIWRAVKDMTRIRAKVSNSALEIARLAGWDDSVMDIETRVKTAIAALEDAGYLKRGRNVPKLFATGIISKNAQEAIGKIMNAESFTEKQKVQAIRIIKKLFSSKNKKKHTDEEAESRVDYISDHLGIVKEDVIQIINLLREENILADTQDLTAFVKRNDKKKRPYHTVELFGRLELFILSYLEQDEKTIHLKEINEAAENVGIANASINKIKTIFNFWAIKNYIRKLNSESKFHLTVSSIHPIDLLKSRLEKRVEIAKFIIDYLYTKSNEEQPEDKLADEMHVEFSIHELKTEFQNQQSLFNIEVGIGDIEDALFYLSKIDAISIEGGFMVLYNSLTIERTEQSKAKQYTKDDYQKLNLFYENKIQQIHIVGEYAQRMLSDYQDALQFVDDYFQLNYSTFLNKYFKGSRKAEIGKNITPAKFKQLFGELSPAQLKIINDQDSQYIMVAAGPGSGKTRVLVHKLASLLLMEDVKHEQLLMLTFSRAAATEFKKRLYALIGNAAAYIEIKTFHAYCFDLLGKIGNLDKVVNIIQTTVEKISSNEVETNRITKTVLVIDEAQDMNQEEYSLIRALMVRNEDMRVIAVGDDDQNIYEFRGANVKYLEEFIHSYQANKIELTENYRSKLNIVDFTNQFVKSIQHRLKQTPVFPNQLENGRLKIIKYQSKNLILPTIHDIVNAELTGTTCVLTRTNESALQIAGQLIKQGLHTKLIQSNDGFNLYNLDEIRFFISQLELGDDVYMINKEKWDIAKNALTEKYKNSTKLEICLNLIKDFESTNQSKRYKSDFESLISESKIEDFYRVSSDIVFVSTIHKAKGKEFDNIFIMLDNFNPVNDEEKRLLYVAMTRAKNNLSIHLNANFLDNLTTDNIERIVDNEHYFPPNELIIHLTHTDVQLGYFETIQHRIKDLESGDILIIKSEGCANMNGEYVLKFSKKAMDQIQTLKTKNYHLKNAKVNFILYWYNESTGRESKIVLPELIFEK